MITNTVSVIVPAFNEQGYIVKCLEALLTALKKTWWDWEVVVVDNESTDRTAEMVWPFLSSRVHLVSTGVRGIGAVRNFGADRATGELLIFVDADTRVTDSAFCGIAGALDDGSVAGGARIFYPYLGRDLVGLAICIVSPIASYFTSSAYGIFCWCLADKFAEIGGYDSRIMLGEDVELLRVLKERFPGKVGGPRGWVISSARRLEHFGSVGVVKQYNAAIGGDAERKWAEQFWYDSPPR